MSTNNISSKPSTMKQLFRNINIYKKRLTQGSARFDSRDYPLFCLTLGYLLNKVDNFNLLYTTLSQALQLVVNDKFPQPQYFQWLLFLQQNPQRIKECIRFIDTIKSDQTIDVFQEMETLYSCEEYNPQLQNNNSKKILKSVHFTASIDTVVMHDSQSPSSSPQLQQKDQLLYKDDHSYNHLDHHHQHQQQQKLPYIDINNDDQYSNFLLMKKLQQQDQQMARRLQQQEENFMRQYKPKANQQQTMCEICFVGLYEGNPAFLDNCGHGFHQQCMIEAFKMQISGNIFPLKCPNQECKQECLESDIKSILTPQLFTKYQQHTLKAYADMHGDSVSWCPTADCGYMFFYQKGDQVRFQCLECKKQYCLNCRCDWHKDMSCAEYKISTTVSEDDQKFLDFVKGKKFKQCPKCKFWVQKNLGCDHMTCKCKFQFCYKCGGVYMKCECVQQAQQIARRRNQMRQQSLKKKKELLQKRIRQKQQKDRQKNERIIRGQQPAKKTRSKKQGKKQGKKQSKK